MPETALATAPTPAKPTMESVAERDRLLAFCNRHDDALEAVGISVGTVGAVAAAVFGLLTAIGTIAIASGLAATALCLLVALPIVYLALLSYGSLTSSRDFSDWVLKRRVSRRLSREQDRYYAAIARADAVQGWRPREGVEHPVGRDDYHDRYRVEAESDDETITLSIRRWSCGPDRVWHEAETLSGHRRVIEDDDPAELEAARAALDEICAQREGRSAVERAEAAAEAQLRAERRAALAAAARAVNELPSV